MAKTKNKKKQSTLTGTQRDVTIPLVVRRKMADDFISMCSMYWKIADNGSVPEADRLALLQNITGFCEDAWNISILSDNMEQASRLLDLNYPADNPARQLAYNMVLFKRKNFPKDRAIVKNVLGTFELNGNPAIDFSLDYSIMEEEARTHKRSMPKLIDIIDKDALERATEGLPPDKVEEAINAELKRQLDVYNNTPQAELGGKSPNQVAQIQH